MLESGLGDNAFVRMVCRVAFQVCSFADDGAQSKQEFGRACGTCARPFTVFRWNPGSGARYKTTVICQTCAKIKNVCQTCLLDLEYGLPTQVRDTALAVQNEAPTSDINREYYAQNMESKVRLQSVLWLMTCADGSYSSRAAVRWWTRIALRQQGKRCSNSSQGQTRITSGIALTYAHSTPRGSATVAVNVPIGTSSHCWFVNWCPYQSRPRHEMPVKNELSKQNIQDRYHGVDDPVAKKILNTHATSMGLAPPEDQSIVCLTDCCGPPTLLTCAVDVHIPHKSTCIGE